MVGDLNQAFGVLYECLYYTTSFISSIFSSNR